MADSAPLRPFFTASLSFSAISIALPGDVPVVDEHVVGGVEHLARVEEVLRVERLLYLPHHLDGGPPLRPEEPPPCEAYPVLGAHRPAGLQHLLVDLVG